jgi:hypothetical protein
MLAIAIAATVAAGRSAWADPLPPQEPRSGLTVAILDLAAAPGLLPTPQAAIRPAWRTTFGSERQTPPPPKPGSHGALMSALAGVDAVLVQGVTSARPLRRLFPPRQWRLIVSRHAARPSWTRDDAGGPAMTAIAVRARPDLRITARAFALRLTPQFIAGDMPLPSMSVEEPTTGEDIEQETEAAEAGTIDDVVSASVPAHDAATERAAALASHDAAGAPHPATAVRMGVDGRTFWLAAVTVPDQCMAEDPPCGSLQAIDRWRAEKLAAGEPALIGSRVNTGLAADQCASYAIESDLAWRRLSPESGGISPEPGEGCMVTLRLGD